MKIGDKVRILPSAVDGLEEYADSIGTITEYGVYSNTPWPFYVEFKNKGIIFSFPFARDELELVEDCK